MGALYLVLDFLLLPLLPQNNLYPSWGLFYPSSEVVDGSSKETRASFPHSPSGYGHVHRGFQLIYVLPLMVILFLFFWLCHAACGILAPCCCCSVAVESVSLQSHGLKHARLPCLSPFSSLTRDPICAP